MSKLRTTSTEDANHGRSEELHRKLEQGAKTAAVHRRKLQQNEREARPVEDSDRGHSHLSTEEPIKPRSQRPVGDPDAGQHPGALLKR